MNWINNFIYFVGIISILFIGAKVGLLVFALVSGEIWDRKRKQKNKEIILKALKEKGCMNVNEFIDFEAREEEKEKQEIKEKNFLYAAYILEKHEKPLFGMKYDSYDKSGISSCLIELQTQGLVEEKGNSWNLENKFYCLTDKAKEQTLSV